jgi:hypothetical protein
MWLESVLEVLWRYGAEIFPVLSMLLGFLVYSEWKEYSWQVERRRLLAELPGKE